MRTPRPLALSVFPTLFVVHGATAQHSSAPAPLDTVRVVATAGTALFFDVTPDGRSIVFDLLGQLWEIPIAGGAARAIGDAAAAPADDRQPAVSPDGGWIAARSDRPAGRGIWLHARAGETARQLTDSAVILGSDVGVPAWSPDGKRLAYSHDGAIIMLALETGKRERLLTPELQRIDTDEPAWSPDGQRMLVSGPWGGASARALLEGPVGSSIWEIDLSQRVASRLTHESVVARAPAYAPDGRRIAYFSADSTGSFRLVSQAPGSQPVVLSSERGIEPRRVRWSPDGTFLIFVAHGRLRRVPATGGPSSEIPFTATLRAARASYTRNPPNLPQPGDSTAARGFTGLAIAPDGGSIGMLALGKLWLIDRQGHVRAVAATLPSANGLTWSPDATQVAWSGGPHAAQDIWITKLATGASRRVTRSANSDSRAAWSPDGRWIAFMHNSGRIHLVDTVAGADSAETPGPAFPWSEYAAFAETPQWTPAGDTLLIYGMNGWPVASRGCVEALLVPLRGEPRRIESFPCRPSHVLLAANGNLIAIEDGVITERTRTTAGWSDPHRTGRVAALYPSISRTGALLYVGAGGLHVRDSDGSEHAIGWPLHFRAPPAKPLLIRNVRLVPIDVPVDTAPQDLLIVNGRIAEIAPAARLRQRVPATATVIDAAGRWVLPGLIDTHNHLYETGLAMARGSLFNGVTTVREMWGSLAMAAAFRDAVAAAVVSGARIVVSGPPFYPMPTGRSVTSDFLWIPVDSATTDRGLQLLRAFDAAHVKMRYTQTWSAAARFIRRAHAFGLPVGSHCAHGLPAILAGIDTHEHADGQCRDWEFGIHEDVAQLYRSARVATVPIIDLHDEQVRSLRDTLRLRVPEVLAFRASMSAHASSDERVLRRIEGRAARARAATAILHGAGVRIAAGSDTEALPGGMPRELEALVAAGLTPADALRAATSHAAAVLGLERELGRLRVDYRADLLLLDANPLADIRNLRRIWMIVQDGRIIDRAALLEAAEARF